MILCCSECLTFIRTLTFKPFTHRQRKRSRNFSPQLCRVHVYQHVNLFTARDSITPWWTAAFVKPVKQMLLIVWLPSIQIHVCAGVKSQIIVAPLLVKLTAHNYPWLLGFIMSFAHENQQYALVCQWETSSFVLCTCQRECVTQCLESKQITANNTRAIAWKKCHFCRQHLMMPTKHKYQLFSFFLLSANPNTEIVKHCHVICVKCVFHFTLYQPLYLFIYKIIIN